MDDSIVIAILLVLMVGASVLIGALLVLAGRAEDRAIDKTREPSDSRKPSRPEPPTLPNIRDSGP
jgi:hypothetical protein